MITHTTAKQSRCVISRFFSRSVGGLDQCTIANTVRSSWFCNMSQSVSLSQTSVSKAYSLMLGDRAIAGGE